MKKFISLTLLAVCFVRTFAQNNNDAALWENIYLEKNLTPRIILHFNHEGRITENITQFHYGYGDLGITYKFGKSFHATIDYVYVGKYLDKSGFSNRHQFYIAGTYKKKITKSLVFSFREMFQEQVQDIYSSEIGRLPVYFSRSKATFKYKLNRFTPYIASELYVKLLEPARTGHLSAPYGPHANRVRYFAGIFYELNRVNEVELYYLIEKHFNEYNPQTNYVIGVGFAHTFY
ncbi:MAG: DUF2490 domain-containing protein [Bacteroidia bacterium]